MHRGLGITGAVLAALAVLLGAFGAHGLQQVVTDDNILQSYRTGVLYQLFHSLAILAAAVIYGFNSGKKVTWAGYSFFTGVFLFSGSIYLITFLKISEIKSPGFIAWLTPAGGLFFLFGWFLLAWGIAGNKKS